MRHNFGDCRVFKATPAERPRPLAGLVTSADRDSRPSSTCLLRSPSGSASRQGSSRAWAQRSSGVSQSRATPTTSSSRSLTVSTPVRILPSPIRLPHTSFKAATTSRVARLTGRPRGKARVRFGAHPWAASAQLTGYRPLFIHGLLRMVTGQKPDLRPRFASGGCYFQRAPRRAHLKENCYG